MKIRIMLRSCRRSSNLGYRSRWNASPGAYSPLDRCLFYSGELPVAPVSFELSSGLFGLIPGPVVPLLIMPLTVLPLSFSLPSIFLPPEEALSSGSFATFAFSLAAAIESSIHLSSLEAPLKPCVVLFVVDPEGIFICFKEAFCAIFLVLDPKPSWLSR